MIAHIIRKAALIAVAATVCCLLVSRYGIGTAAAVWAGAAAVACVAGAVLLRTSAVGRITWKNWTAAYLMPWGARLCGGVLWPIPVTSWCVWMAVAAAVFVLTPGPGEEPVEAAEAVRRVALGTAWVIDGGALLYLVGTIRQHYTVTSRSGRSLFTICAVLVGLIVVSAVFHLLGLPYLALLVAGGPPLVVAVGYGLFVGMMLAFSNGRWN